MEPNLSGFRFGLDAPPWNRGTAEDTGSRQGGSHEKGPRDGLVVRGLDAGQILLGQVLLQVGDARAENSLGIQIRHILGEGRQQLVGKDRLRNADKQGAAQRLQKGNHGRAGGNVLEVEHVLDGHERLLHAHADAGAEQDLVADPGGRACVWLEGREKARADGHDDGAEDHEGRVVAHGRDKRAREDGEDDDADQHGQVARAGLDGRGALDGLEPDGDVVDHQVKRGAEEEDVQAASPYRSVADDARRHRGVFALAPLDEDEAGEEDAEEDEEGNDAAVLPGVEGAAPLEGEEQADDGGDEEQVAEGVEAHDFVDEGGGFAPGPGLLGFGEEEEDDDDGDGADGEVDEEAPSPGLNVITILIA